mmetsp:Transcript_20265/g.63697  ORF Transcript_20265/g.63697 Transcript_20265/m.63697 type:complete len:291 (-) Transcript_20265:26-898(-)
MALLDEFRYLIDLVLLFVDEVGEVAEDFVDFVDVAVDLANLVLSLLQDGVVDGLLLHGDLELDSFFADHDVQVARGVGGSELGVADAVRPGLDGLRRGGLLGEGVPPALLELGQDASEVARDPVGVLVQLRVGRPGPRLLRPRHAFYLRRHLPQPSAHRRPELLDHFLLRRDLPQRLVRGPRPRRVQRLAQSLQERQVVLELPQPLADLPRRLLDVRPPRLGRPRPAGPPAISRSTGDARPPARHPAREPDPAAARPLPAPPEFTERHPRTPPTPRGGSSRGTSAPYDKE